MWTWGEWSHTPWEGKRESWDKPDLLQQGWVGIFAGEGETRKKEVAWGNLDKESMTNSLIFVMQMSQRGDTGHWMDARHVVDLVNYVQVAERWSTVGAFNIDHLKEIAFNKVSKGGQKLFQMRAMSRGAAASSAAEEWVIKASPTSSWSCIAQHCNSTSQTGVAVPPSRSRSSSRRSRSRSRSSSSIEIALSKGATSGAYPNNAVRMLQ